MDVRETTFAPPTFPTPQEANTGSNLPAQIELYAKAGDEYDFMFIAKGGGSANKTFLFHFYKLNNAPQEP